MATIANEVRRCTRCQLHLARRKAVPGEGPRQANLVLIGEAPGEQEDRVGRPFVGRAGQVLDQCLQAARIVRGEIFITNLVKCRPPQNRIPLRTEIDTCTAAYLRDQIRIINPALVVLLGATAVKALLGVPLLSQARGHFIQRDRLYLATYHPAAGLRNPAWRQALQDDLIRARRWLDRFHPR
ncbi:MAG: uracil-DNA glycosylase [Pseudomonadota bacterium]